jgi:hypothetical protein
MKGFLYISDEKIGEIDLGIIDESMGVIGGELNVYPSYERYREAIQLLYETKGTANSEDFIFILILEDATVIRPQGGIGVTDSAEFNERVVEISGVDWDTVMRVSKGKLDGKAN